MDFLIFKFKKQATRFGLQTNKTKQDQTLPNKNTSILQTGVWTF